MIPRTYDSWREHFKPSRKNFMEAQHAKASTLVFGEPSPMTHHLCGTRFGGQPPRGKLLTSWWHQNAKPLNPHGMRWGSLLMNLYWKFGVLVPYLSDYFKNRFIYIQNHSDFHHQIITKLGPIWQHRLHQSMAMAGCVVFALQPSKADTTKAKRLRWFCKTLMLTSNRMNHSVLTLWHAHYNRETLYPSHFWIWGLSPKMPQN